MCSLADSPSPRRRPRAHDPHADGAAAGRARWRLVTAAPSEAGRLGPRRLRRSGLRRRDQADLHDRCPRCTSSTVHPSDQCEPVRARSPHVPGPGPAPRVPGAHADERPCAAPRRRLDAAALGRCSTSRARSALEHRPLGDDRQIGASSDDRRVPTHRPDKKYRPRWRAPTVRGQAPSPGDASRARPSAPAARSRDRALRAEHAATPASLAPTSTRRPTRCGAVLPSDPERRRGACGDDGTTTWPSGSRSPATAPWRALRLRARRRWDRPALPRREAPWRDGDRPSVPRLRVTSGRGGHDPARCAELVRRPRPAPVGRRGAAPSRCRRGHPGQPLQARRSRDGVLGGLDQRAADAAPARRRRPRRGRFTCATSSADRAVRSSRRSRTRAALRRRRGAEAAEVARRHEPREERAVARVVGRLDAVRSADGRERGSRRRAASGSGRVRRHGHDRGCVRPPAMRTCVRALGQPEDRRGRADPPARLPRRGRRPPLRRARGPRHPLLRGPREVRPQPRPRKRRRCRSAGRSTRTGAAPMHAHTVSPARPTSTSTSTPAGTSRRRSSSRSTCPRCCGPSSRRPSWKGEHVAMGTNTDPYQWVEGRYKLMRGIWEAMRDFANPCSILTKSPLLLRDLDLMQEIAAGRRSRANLSIPTIDEKAWRATEPHTPNPRARMEAVGELNRPASRRASSSRRSCRASTTRPSRSSGSSSWPPRPARPASAGSRCTCAARCKRDLLGLAARRTGRTSSRATRSSTRAARTRRRPSASGSAAWSRRGARAVPQRPAAASRAAGRARVRRWRRTRRDRAAAGGATPALF